MQILTLAFPLLLLLLSGPGEARKAHGHRRRHIKRAAEASSNLYPIQPLLSYTASPLDEASLGKLGPRNKNKDIVFEPAPAGSSSVASAPDTGNGTTPTPRQEEGTAQAIQATYPEGSYTLNKGDGGFSFYLVPPASTIDLSSAREMTFTYSVYFEPGFDFNIGGKLFGLFGGNNVDESISCSGGRQEGRDACFSVRTMWRKSGAGELYLYLPKGKSKDYCSQPGNHCNADFGDSVGRGSFAFAAGQWTTVTMRVKLNSIGQQDGEIELWANGRSVVTLTGIVLRTSEAAKFFGLMCQTFFGGGKPEFASKKTQKAFFKDLAVAVTQQWSKPTA